MTWSWRSRFRTAASWQSNVDAGAFSVTPMRILFLDFDGVLHPSAEYTVKSYFCWLPKLEWLLDKHRDVMICVHSTWRYDHSDDELRALLGSLGERFIGCAPRGPRGLAIETVLQANKHLVRSHLVIDDDAEDFVETRLRVLLVDGRVGISDPTAQLPFVEWLLSTASSGTDPE